MGNRPDDPLARVESDETWRREQFPACRDRIFMAHAAVTAIPRAAVTAMDEFNRASATGEIDYTRLLFNDMDRIRATGARLIGASAGEISLLGPTSLGLSLVANGLDWQPGDEVITYLDDYPANVYPWKNLERLGVKVVYLQPSETGRLTPELVEAACTSRTRLLALASNHFLTGWKLDVAAIGALARSREILFCLDAIQTVGAMPTDASQVDFLCADSHKWMLGPMTAGLFYVKKEHQELLRPTLLGAWNVKSPNFIAHDAVDFEAGGRRYEPGVLNSSCLLGMEASMDLLLGIGLDRVAGRLAVIKEQLCDGLEKLGFRIVGPRRGSETTGITTVIDPRRPERISALFRELAAREIVTSYRHDRAGVPHLRFSPHFYNTFAEVETLLGVLRASRA
jgi:cysteine desulfurase / selenocysteine lyase